MSKTEIITHLDCIAHTPGSAHPEKPDRLLKVIDELKQTFGDQESVVWLEAPLGTDEQILLCHSPEYLAQLKKWDFSLSSDEVDLIATDVDTRISKGSLNAARRAVGAVTFGVDQICSGETKNAFCAVRPPGHHALKNSSMGFCLFGYAAIAAHYALSKEGIERVAVIDFDVHHGNGTQALVEDNQQILFFSIHQDGLWPYEGEADDRGRVDNIRNFPIPEKSSPDIYYKIFENNIIPELEKFRPDFFIISAGFDAHKDDPPESDLFNDPAGRQLLDESDYRKITRIILDSAERHAGGRLLSIMEGGYNVEVLAKSCAAHLAELTK